ncbi:MAG TPA: hypothetical protein VJU82_02235 [Acidobacteriaceae bacterium]|nr:hypothetical protein [Acidobacteriaceae bacterium]
MLVLIASGSLDSYAQKPGHKKSKSAAQGTASQATAPDDISGMYTFLREGEFVQITAESGKLSGFVSRYGERESDRDVFLDQFFSKASLEGNHMAFTTKPVHGTWYEFSGDVNRGDAKTPDQEGYWVIRGTLKQYDPDESGQVASKSREITMKSFPQDTEETPK